MDSTQEKNEKKTGIGTAGEGKEREIFSTHSKKRGKGASKGRGRGR